MKIFKLILLQLGLIFNFNTQINFNDLYITNYQLEQTLLEIPKISKEINEEQKNEDINYNLSNNSKIKNDLKEENFNKKELTIEEQNNEESISKNLYKNLNFISSYEDLFLEETSGIYNYCPSILVNDDINIFYCSSINSNEIKDYICYRKVNNENNGYYYTSKKIVLSPSGNTSDWDSVHVCDPSVIYGDFNYNGTNYHYLMAYLGCNSLDNQNNQIGLALSNSIDSNWIKLQNNPFISYNYGTSQNSFQWGVGQPSLINVGNNNVLIFYTKGTWNLTCEIVELWNLSDLNNPIKLGEAMMKNPNNNFISNADFALQGTTLYMVCDKHPFDNGILNNIPNESNIYRTNIDLNNIISSLQNCSWEQIFNINSNITSHKRNHNIGFFKDSYGNLVQNSVLYTIGDEINDFSSSLYTYRLKRLDF